MKTLTKYLFKFTLLQHLLLEWHFYILTFQVDDLVAIEEEIELEVKALETCAYSNAVFTEILGKIQKAVDNLSLHSYSNLPQWVAKLDQRVRLKIQ